MFVFQSMSHISLFTTLVVLVFVWVATRMVPHISVIQFIKQLMTSRKFLLHFGALLLILYLNKLEMKVESTLGVPYDYANLFHSIEGDLVYWIQHTFLNPNLTYLLTFIYVIVFPALMIASLIIYTGTGKHKMFYATCYAIMTNYIVAIPFYLFLPVNEVWYFHPHVDFLIPSIFPSFEQDYRPLSGLNNCFPSLHTSISVTVALLAYQSGNRVWKWITGVSALLVLFSIFYLGIHWFVDMLGGVALAVTAATLGMKLAARTEYMGELQLGTSVRSRQKVSEN
ncbi:phosphoesterase PA-phosphatase [Paenibacillus swuensis]|uniref:Phosphoesterase PA-phosphatase n=1 Tax=Paenibacillus swuensis TaxID=1178515 RepID=A0A172TK98_9BACL|nr:phosphatase PAP2 family protein [Paenibacillus swuensis]ANE47193.1 phosphoesterase PA-phosphatase [Paenibacillus swuensis]